MEEKVLAFAFSAAEFLDEEIEELEEEYGTLSFIKNGKFKKNKSSNHPYEWWATQKDVDEINILIKNK